MSRYCKHGCDPRNCYECSSERTALGPSDVTACSPSSLTPETDAAWDIFQNSPHDDAGDPWALCSRMERERDEAIKDDEKARAYKRVLKNENARLRRMLNLPENACEHTTPRNEA